MFLTALLQSVLLLLDVTRSIRQQSDRPRHSTTTCVIDLEEGSVLGEETFAKASRGEGRVVRFPAIPFASPPVGPLRWRSPQPVKRWKGVYDGRGREVACIQSTVSGRFYKSRLPQSMDCLQLNVFTFAPSLPSSRHGDPRRTSTIFEAPTPTLRPVFVFLHGGAFSVGSASEWINGTFLAAQLGAVVVTPNYRLGMEGFLVHKDLSAEEGGSNFGLQDQRAALQWVQRNIRLFGGDPDRVTLAGFSAGAQSVLYHLLSPSSIALFSRVYAASPVLGVGMLDLHEATELRGSQVDRLGKKTIDGLRDVDAKRVDRAVRGWSRSASRDASYPSARMPVADGVNIPSNNVLRLFEEASFAGKPLLLTVTRDESSVFLMRVLATLRNDTFDGIIDNAFGDTRGPLVRAHYNATLSEKGPWATLAEIQTASLIACPLRFVARYASSYHVPLFLGLWSNRPSAAKGFPGAHHGIDMPILLSPPSKRNRAISEASIEYLRQFIEGEERELSTTVKWPSRGLRRDPRIRVPYDAERVAWRAYEKKSKFATMVWETSTLGTQEDAIASMFDCDFWDQLYASDTDPDKVYGHPFIFMERLAPHIEPLHHTIINLMAFYALEASLRWTALVPSAIDISLALVLVTLVLALCCRRRKRSEDERPESSGQASPVVKHARGPGPPEGYGSTKRRSVSERR
ncbi:unnamed protein product [Vitrella brassicaformis CCMP3155]|uniref:Carboxylic ester hydrolase n=2 Tax=Vitrella brassicaformis TaxID=1169539 RepID=A0A0G4GUS1_VITBC|nr:unnamed protein product [Vitrella brassicaformis CCMP3155]|mmetsp:Transcript_13645/g.32484  ORF Transcript_13645/g.32484 Transcript_13645/m.32484 type:complete len:687 (+) Transcript_13645:58-2118(+)|eukprot:CEM34593.1 unnamed protein product [Vitrella brassicaformis CCMP3155]